MALSKTKLAATFSNLIDQLPITISYDGTDYTGTKTSISVEKVFQEEGSKYQYRFSVLIPQSEFSTLPQPRELVTISGTEYRILNTATDAADVGIRLDLGAKY